MGESSAFYSNAAQFDGGLDRNDRTMVERANRPNDVVYNDRTVRSGTTLRPTQALVTPKHDVFTDIS